MPRADEKNAVSQSEIGGEKRIYQHLPTKGFTGRISEDIGLISGPLGVSQKNIGPELMARRVVGKVPAGSHGAERVTASDETPVEIVIL